MFIIKPILVLVIILVSVTDSRADSYDPNNYLPPDCSVKLEETNLPIVFIDTQYGKESKTIIHKDWRVAARIKIIINDNGVNYSDTTAHPGQKVDYEGWIAIKYRGYTSFSLSKKKPFSIKTMESSDPEGKKKKVCIMGLPKDNDWVLIAPYSDRSLIRDVLMFQLARPYLEFTPKVRHCEVILDGVYYGVYVMAEHISKGENRLNLSEPGSAGDELTGDYHLEIDHLDEEHLYVSKYPTLDENGVPHGIPNSVCFQYKFPKYEDMVPGHEEQLEYIQKQIDLMEDALDSDHFSDAETGYRRYLDIMSFIDHELSQEVSGNVDAYRLSTNIYKHRDSVDPRFKTTIWDFNLAFGNNRENNGELTDYWLFLNKYINPAEKSKVPFWWARMMQDPEYVKLLKARWAQYRKENYSDEHLNNTIDSLVAILDAKGARERNYQAFPVWGENIWPVPNYNSVNTWEKEISYLKNWIKRRIAWMDEQLDYDPTTIGFGVMMPDATFKKEITGYYDSKGQRLEHPRKGIVIIKHSDGTSRILFVCGN